MAAQDTGAGAPKPNPPEALKKSRVVTDVVYRGTVCTEDGDFGPGQEVSLSAADHRRLSGLGTGREPDPEEAEGVRMHVDSGPSITSATS